MPSYLPSMQHLKNREIREKLYRAYTTRASSFSPKEADKTLDNEPHIARILQLKRAMAKLLGYNTYAEVSLASKAGNRCQPCVYITGQPGPAVIICMNIRDSCMDQCSGVMCVDQ